MNYTIEHQGKNVIFTLKQKSVTSEISAQLKAQLLIICQPDIDALILDLSNVEMIDSSGLGAFLLAHRQLKEHAIPIALVGVNPMVASLLRISQIDNLFDVFDTVDSAIETFAEEQ